MPNRLAYWLSCSIRCALTTSVLLVAAPLVRAQPSPLNYWTALNLSVTANDIHCAHKWPARKGVVKGSEGVLGL